MLRKAGRSSLPAFAPAGRSGLRRESVVTVSEFLAHPAYLNSGEIPSGRRGKLGGTPLFAPLDLHVNYARPISERLRLNFVADIFNVTNNRLATFRRKNEAWGPHSAFI